ncbi:MAG: hypothetical protein HY817_02870 [Candidatus Abawacabacteria bacterium]|nr:hypothetical protein [Candidatus Abawacabacteria bacterium]
MSPQHYFRRMSVVLFALICVIWVSIYGVIITGAFSRAFWASMTAVDVLVK